MQGRDPDLFSESRVESSSLVKSSYANKPAFIRKLEMLFKYIKYILTQWIVIIPNGFVLMNYSLRNIYI